MRTLVLIGLTNFEDFRHHYELRNVILFDMILMDGGSKTKLKLAMLSAETVGQFAAIIIDYTHEEMMLVFHELEWEEQARIKDIWKSI
ncbi:MULTISPECIES: hypothetical protein [unclassified Microcoleus]|uniref:hypothetical protein n=1 Tax=unclassified Microcoleus TaxID=2642155 RepID=UPI002FD00B47